MNKAGLQAIQQWLKDEESSAPTRDWRSRARCAGQGIDPEAFFPEKVEDAIVPLKICRRCPVRAECGENREPHGIWGGLTESQWRAVARRRMVEAGGRAAA